jgi:hypothetical protein
LNHRTYKAITNHMISDTSAPAAPTAPQKMAELQYELDVHDARERLRQQLELALVALRSLILVNGGAIVALFTFVGNSEASFDARAIWFAFTWFIVGLVLALLSLILGFVAQANYTSLSWSTAYEHQGVMLSIPIDFEKEKARENKFGNVAELSALAAAFLSLVFFAIGAGCALSGVLH